MYMFTYITVRPLLLGKLMEPFLHPSLHHIYYESSSFVTLSIYVESQQWRPALETKANNTGYEITVVTLTKLPQKRRGGEEEDKEGRGENINIPKK